MVPFHLLKRKFKKSNSFNYSDWWYYPYARYYDFKPDPKKRPLSGSYTEFPQNGYILTVREYYGLIKNERLLPSDGCGFPIRDNRLDPNIQICPSARGEDVPRDATHIEWHPDDGD